MKDNDGTGSVSKVLVVALIGIMIGSGFVGAMSGIGGNKGNNRMSKTVEEGLIACWHFDENTGNIAYDSSGNSNDGTIYSANWTTGVSGSALNFNGVDDYVDCGDISATDSMTIEAWINPATTGGYIVTKYLSGSPTVGRSYAMTLGQSKLEGWIGRTGTANPGEYTSIDSNYTIPLNIFTHVSVVLDHEKGVLSLYINGELDSWVNTTDTPSQTSTPVYIGASVNYEEGVGGFFNGTIDEVSIYNKALNASEIQAHYEYYAPDLVACWHFNENTGTTAYDSSGNSNDGTIYGASWTTGISGSALSFDGSNDYINVPDSTSLDVTEAITLEAWVKPGFNFTNETLYGKYEVLLNKEDGTGDGYQLFYLSGYIYLNLGDGTWHAVTTPINLYADNWYHIVGTYDGSNMKLFINGQQVANETWSGTISSISNNLWIGKNKWNDNIYFNGTIDEISIYNKALNASEIQAHYEEYAPDLVACWHFDENTGTIAYDSSGNNNDGTIYGASWTTGISGSALSFDGVDDYVDVGTMGDFGSTLDGDKTYELWLKTTSTAKRALFGTYNDGFNTQVLLELNTEAHSQVPGKIGFDLRDDGHSDSRHLQFFTSTAYNFYDGNWHHLVVITKPGTNTAEVYWDGKNQSIMYTYQNILGPFSNFQYTMILGAVNVRGFIDGYFNGTIDEVSIYNKALTASEIQAHYEEYADALPDLTLTSDDISFSNSNPNVDETIMINATIHNVGGNISQTSSNWDVKTEMNDDEFNSSTGELSEWGLEESYAKNCASVYNGILTLNCTGENKEWFYEKFDDNLSNSVGTTFEVREKVISADNSATASITHNIQDGERTFVFGLWMDKIQLNGQVEDIYEMNTTDTYHIYRIVTKGDTSKLYVDGILRLTSDTPLYNTTYKTVAFGDTTYNSGFDFVTEVDYVYYTTKGAFPPGVVVWEVKTEMNNDEFNSSIGELIEWTLHENHVGIAASIIADEDRTILRLHTDEADKNWYYQILDNSIDKDTGFTAEVCLKLIKLYGNDPFILNYYDGEYLFSLGIYEDRIKVSENTHYMDTTNDYHIYRFYIKGDISHVYVDNVLVLTSGALYPIATKGIDFGDTSVIGEGIDVYVDYVCYTTKGAFAPEVAVNFYDGNPSANGTLIGTDTVSSIPAGSSTTTSINWTTTTEGNHTIYVVVDPDNLITESDETNNEAWKNITVQTVANQPPVVNITYPVNNQTVNGTVTITGTAYDPDNDSGLVGYWHFDENTGTTAYDSSGNNNNGTIYGANWTPGKFNSSLYFDGIDDYVDCGYSDIFAFGYSDFSIELWFKTNLSQRGMFINTMREVSAEFGIYAVMESDGRLTFSIETPDPYGPDGGSQYSVSTNNNYNDNLWHFVVFIRENETGRIIVDGTQDGDTVDFPGNVQVYVPLYIGRRYGTKWGTNFFNGTLDDVRIYNRALSANEIQTHYEGSSGVQKVEIKIDDGNWELVSGTTSWSFDWDTTTVSNGWHTIYVRAFDGVDYSEIKSVSVYVDDAVPDTTPPQISEVQASPSVQEAGGWVNLTCTVTDNVAVDTVMINISAPDYTFENVLMTRIEGTDTYYYNAIYTVIGDYDYLIYANDTSGNWNCSEVYQFTIQEGNQPPTAVSLYDPTDITTNSMILTWTQNTDDDFAKYEIYQSASTGVLGTLIDTITEQTTMSYTVTGLSQDTMYCFTVRVVDTGNLYSDSNQVSGKTLKENQPPIATIDSITPNPAIQSQSVGFVGHGDDSDGSVVDYYWYSSVDGFLSNQNSFSISILSVGTHTISFKVMDDDGEWSDEDTETLMINLNVPPTVDVTYPEDNQTVNGIITITCIASDSDGTVEKVEIKIDDGDWQLATGTSSWSFEWNTTLVSDGLHAVYARSYDGFDYSETGSVSVNVLNVVNQPPVAEFTVYQGIDVANGDEVNVTLRVSGEKYRFVNLSIYADGDEVGFISLEREPGAPETDYRLISIDSSRVYTIVIDYTAEKKGGNPVWLDIDYNGIFYEEHMVFHETSTEEFNLSMILDGMIRSAKMVRFDASDSSDPDGSITNYTWDFGDSCIGYGCIVVHTYEDYDTYTVSLSVMDGSGDTGIISKDVDVLDVTGYYAACNGQFGVVLDCPADLLITDGFGRIIGYNSVNLSFENWVPNSSMILFGDVEIYFIPKDGDYAYRVSGNGEGSYVFSVFDPGEYSPGEYGPGEYGPGEYGPGEYEGKVYSLNSTVTGSGIDDLYVANGSVSISSNTDKYYSLYIKRNGESFSLEDVHITSDITHNYTVVDWSVLSSTDTPSVKLEIFNGSILEAAQELCSGLFGYNLLKPDLTIVNVVTSDPFREGEIVSFSVQILNKAVVTHTSLGVAKDVYVRLYVDDEYVGSSQHISLIYSNSTAYTVIQWRVKPGSHTLRFVVYTADDVDSSNNEYIMNVNIEGKTPVLVISPEVVAIAAGAGIGAGLVLFALIGTEIGKYKLFTFLAPLYLKTKKEEVLDNFIRGQIYGYVKANPGVHYNLIKTELNLKNGSVTYHLNMLERQGYVKSQFDGIYRRFYPKDMKIPTMDITAMSKMQLSIINKILERPDITQKDIAKGIRESKQVVSYHLKVLSKAGIVRLKREGRETRCYVTNEFQSYVRLNNGSMIG